MLKIPQYWLRYFMTQELNFSPANPYVEKVRNEKRLMQSYSRIKDPQSGSAEIGHFHTFSTGINFSSVFEPVIISLLRFSRRKCFEAIVVCNILYNLN